MCGYSPSYGREHCHDETDFQKYFSGYDRCDGFTKPDSHGQSHEDEFHNQLGDDCAKQSPSEGE